jgi:uncharacterized protein YciI
MLFIVHALDKPDALPTRQANYAAHKEFLTTCGEYGVKMVMSGPLVADDGSAMIGSFMLLEAADRATVERFNRADPFHKAGIWDGVKVTAFLRRVG